MNLKIIKLAVCVLLALSASSGCMQKAPEATDNRRLTIVTSFFPMYVHAINVAKGIEGVDVVNMTGPQTGCLHDYQLTARDLKTLEKAKVFIVNGAGMEAFMDKVIKQMPSLKIIEASKGIPLIEGDGQKGGNPHVWVSISNAILQVKNIGREMAAIDPAHAGQYRANTDAYVKKLDQLRIKMHKVLDPVQNKRIVTFHEAFPYFAREFNLDIATVVEREPGSAPGAKELADTIAIIKNNKVKALFAEPQYPVKAAEVIARETAVKIYTLDPCVTGEADGDADAYLKIMEKNLSVLQEALK